MLTNSKLWQGIEAFDLDRRGDENSFSARLARENSWSSEKARAAIAEYKRFIYLVCVAPAPLAPPEAVDQVWRLHLADTRSYWTDLCEGTLGRPIHHDLTDGPRAYHMLDAYAHARLLYAMEFDCAPPAEFWPLVSERFAAALGPIEPDAARCWVAPSPSGLGSILWCAVAALCAVIAGTEHAAAADPAGAIHSGSIVPLLVPAGAVALTWLVARGAGRCRRAAAR